MTFDVALSLSEDELNRGSAAVWNKLHPLGKVFRGSGNLSLGGIAIDVTYDATQPPIFDLAPPPEIVSLIASTLPQENDTDTRELIAYAASIAPAFSLTFPSLAFTFGDRKSPPTPLVTDIRVTCAVAAVNGTISFQALAATAPTQPTVGAQFIVDNFILPAVLSAANALFKGLTIPPLSVPRVALTAPVITIARQRLYVAAALAGAGVPSIPAEGIDGPTAPFVMLLTQRAMQAAASHAIGESGALNRSDSKGDSAFNAHYHFSFRLAAPRVTLRGTELDIAFSLTGSINAGVTVFFVDIGLGYDAVAVPNPTATCSIVPGSGGLRIVESSIRPFTLLVRPSGPIPSKVMSWMTEFIVQGIVGSLTPLITLFLKGIDFTTLQVPSFTESIDGVAITMTPINLQVTGVPGAIALAGSLRFS
ncbi:hypothetical protein [Sorangium sp. So ce394]|uniref:hypothetical protein n=1 Tax=Sorangium sp. So ce394 TaxID=3133310 RepID=UPI003F5AEFE3